MHMHMLTRQRLDFTHGTTYGEVSQLMVLCAKSTVITRLWTESSALSLCQESVLHRRHEIRATTVHANQHVSQQVRFLKANGSEVREVGARAYPSVHRSTPVCIALVDVLGSGRRGQPHQNSQRRASRPAAARVPACLYTY